MNLPFIFYYLVRAAVQLISRVNIVVMLMKLHLHIDGQRKKIFSGAAALANQLVQIFISQLDHLGYSVPIKTKSMRACRFLKGVDFTN